jgi:hypothetical protein
MASYPRKEIWRSATLTFEVVLSPGHFDEMQFARVGRLPFPAAAIAVAVRGFNFLGARRAVSSIRVRAWT